MKEDSASVSAVAEEDVENLVEEHNENLVEEHNENLIEEHKENSMEDVKDIKPIKEEEMDEKPGDVIYNLKVEADS